MSDLPSPLLGLPLLLGYDPLRMLYQHYWVEQNVPITPSPGGLDFIHLDHDVIPYIEEEVNPARNLLVLGQYGYFQKRIEAIRTQSHHRGVILTGNPGIGKSSFLIYLLILYLFKRQPLAMYSRNELYAFTEQGSFLLTPDHYRPFLFYPPYKSMPLLVDSDTKIGSPPMNLMMSPLFPIHTSSPQRTHYIDWFKERSPVMLVMNLPSNDDLVSLARLLPSADGASNIDEEAFAAKVVGIITLYGRNSRTIAQVLLHGAEVYEVEVTRQLNTLNLDKFIGLIKKPEDADDLTISHVLIQTSPLALEAPPEASPKYVTSDIMVHSVQTRHIFKKIWLLFSQTSQEMRRRFVELMSGIPAAASMRGWVFEAWCHEYLSSCQGSLTLTKMVLSPDEKFLVASDQKTTLSVQRRDISTYHSKTKVAHTRGAGKYYVPQSPNNTTFDSFVRPSDDLGIGFQITISSTHTLKPEGLRNLGDRLDTQQVYFIFVVPRNHSFKCEPPPSSSSIKFFVLETDYELQSIYPWSEVLNIDLADDEGGGTRSLLLTDPANPEVSMGSSNKHAHQPTPAEDMGMEKRRKRRKYDHHQKGVSDASVRPSKRTRKKS